MNNLEDLRSGRLAGATRFVLAAGLTDFPREIFELSATLEHLDLAGNALSSLPDDFYCLKQLRVLFCAGNKFTELPAVLGKCPKLQMLGFRNNLIETVPGTSLGQSLRWLILTGNRITELPSEIGLCTALQKVALAGNQLTDLPVQMAACTKLELLRISANRFETLPAWLMAMPRLAWLGFGGNPFSARAETSALTESVVQDILWSTLVIHPEKKLGEGASGVIYQASCIPSTGKDVAVKLFKGDMTSDGLPQSEIAAFLSSGQHPNLIPLIGKVSAHPTGTEALVMPLIEYSNLAGPPNFQTCTRDVYATDVRFTLSSAIRIAHSVAGAANHLHSKFISHGDLYAHNILYQPSDGHSFLGNCKHKYANYF